MSGKDSGLHYFKVSVDAIFMLRWVDVDGPRKEVENLVGMRLAAETNRNVAEGDATVRDVGFAA